MLEPENDGAGANIYGRVASISNASIVSFTASDLDKVTAYRAGLQYGLSSKNTVDLGYEQVIWEPALATGTDTEERYITLGLGHTFNPNASMKLLYQIVEYEQGTGVGALSPYGPLGNYRGGVATAQFAVKF